MFYSMLNEAILAASESPAVEVIGDLGWSIRTFGEAAISDRETTTVLTAMASEYDASGPRLGWSRRTNPSQRAAPHLGRLLCKRSNSGRVWRNMLTPGGHSPPYGVWSRNAVASLTSFR